MTAFNKDDQRELIRQLDCTGEEKTALYEEAARVKKENVGNIVYFRGLIEFSNRCRKNCLYCGIRSGNKDVIRYDLSDDEIIESARFAFENRYGSVVLQSGEVTGSSEVKRVGRLVEKIHAATNAGLRITLSCGEQKAEVYRSWFNSGAQRYLLRIETSNPILYSKIHPDDMNHSFSARIKCLDDIRKAGFQTGTGVMTGLPFQTLSDLADDLLFMERLEIDMVGMGPYIEHSGTPLFEHRHLAPPLKERFDLTLKMIALLRIRMKNINIAATTAMQAIDRLGREKAIMAGANVIMPNITPGSYRDDYLLYEGKPCTDEDREDCRTCLEARMALTGNEIAYGEWGDSAHYKWKNKS